jgi:hypothetical protein
MVFLRVNEKVLIGGFVLLNAYFTQFLVVTVYENSLKITKPVIRSRVIRRSDNKMAIRKKSKGHTAIYITLHRKLSIEHQKTPNQNLFVHTQEKNNKTSYSLRK